MDPFRQGEKATSQDRSKEMNRQKFDVAVVGGGIGGLCLAQGLKKAGVRVTVYERDETAASRSQGYRVHIDPQGSTALHQCLPEDLWKIFDATEGDYSQGFTLITEQLQELLCLRTGDGAADPVARHRSISRITLRHVLLAGLQDAVHFNRRFVCYEELPDGRCTLHFEDGSSAEADVVVAADGVNSGVRKQYLPHAEPIDTGVVALGGKIRLSDGVMALAPHRLLDGPVMVTPPEACSLFMAIWRRPADANQALRLLGIDGPPEGDEDYMILGFGGRPEYFGLSRDLDSMPAGAGKEAMRKTVARWHPDLRKLVEMADDKEIFVSRLRTSRPMDPWKTSHITLLGDAIHSMTPYRGIGANIALKDAALLAAKLIEASYSKRPLLDAIAEYEISMREYAFAAVESSRKSMEQAVGEKKYPIFGITKTAMRVVNAVPSLRKRLAIA
jgi:2-polyprenyl-6-methoxyphenol hydroxylase-like FAD-dependent oxidoreductase